MKYLIRKAQAGDLRVIEQLYAQARSFMAAHGNPSQWGTAYPPADLLRQDIARETLFLIYDEAGIHGVFYFCIEFDPAYAVIYDGAWRENSPYGVIHRIAGDGSGGILRTAVEFARGQISHLRIDTHEDNDVMQKALEKQGFLRCGLIRLEDGSRRIAYERTE